MAWPNGASALSCRIVTTSPPDLLPSAPEKHIIGGLYQFACTQPRGKPHAPNRPLFSDQAANVAPPTLRSQK